MKTLSVAAVALAGGGDRSTGRESADARAKAPLGAGLGFLSRALSVVATIGRAVGSGTGTAVVLRGETDATAGIVGSDLGLVVFVLVLAAEQRRQQVLLRLGDVDADIAGGIERHLRRHRATLLHVGEGERIAGQRAAIGRNVDGAAVREHAGELVVGHARPVAHAADVEMDEIRTRIEADAAALQAKPGDPDRFERYARDM